MLAHFAVDPPLGHPTVVSADAEGVKFNIVIEASTATATRDYSWDIAIWHNLKGSEKWSELTLERAHDVKEEDDSSTSSSDGVFAVLLPTGFHTEAGSPRRRVFRRFTGILKGRPDLLRPISFTVKFRVRHDLTHDSGGAAAGAEWKWIKDLTGASDGQLYYQSGPIDQPLTHYLPMSNPDIKYEEVQSQSPSARAWSLSASVAAASSIEDGDRSGYSEFALDLPLSWTHWYASVRHDSPWLGPRHGGGPGQALADKDAVFYSFLRTDGVHVLIMAASGIDDVSSVLKVSTAGLVLAARNDRTDKGTARGVITVATSFGDALAAAMYHIRGLVKPYGNMQSVIPPTNVNDKTESPVSTKWFQDWTDGLTYCTYNSLGLELTKKKLLDALAALRNAGVPISNLIIDDNWQSLNNVTDPLMTRSMTDFEANKDVFPDGLQEGIASIREVLPQLSQISVWHALLGYWGGISPTGPLAEKYELTEVRRAARPPWTTSIHVVAAADVPKFYTDFYDFLARAGITGVKTDAQFMLDTVSNASARRQLTTLYADTWHAEQLRHFYGKAISCMSQTPTLTFHAQLPKTSLPVVLRNSDDFFPNEDSSHPWHIFCNAHNATVSQYLNVLPDWDMFQTVHPWAAFHAAARCISGGPITITDKPGKYDLDLIAKMTARTPQGETTALRPSVIGTAQDHYIPYAAARLLRIGAYNGASTLGTSFLGVFNCTPRSLREIIPLTAFPGANWRGRRYVLRSFVSNRISRALLPSDDTAFSLLEVPGHAFDILTANPSMDFSFTSSTATTMTPRHVSLCNLGLLDKFTGAAAITLTRADLQPAAVSTNSSSAADRVRVRRHLHCTTRLKGYGKLGIVVERQGTGYVDLDADVMVLLTDEPVSRDCVRVHAISDDGDVQSTNIHDTGKSKHGLARSLIEIDLVQAAKEAGSPPSWSFEVAVDVLVAVE